MGKSAVMHSVQDQGEAVLQNEYQQEYFCYEEHNTKENIADNLVFEIRGKLLRVVSINESKKNKERNFEQNHQEGLQDSNKQNLYCREFPKISSNFEKSCPNLQNTNQNVPNPNISASSNTKSSLANKHDKVPEPAPYNEVERLRFIHAERSPTIVLKTTPRETTKQGKPTVIFGMYIHLQCTLNILLLRSIVLPCIRWNLLGRVLSNTVN